LGENGKPNFDVKFFRFSNVVKAKNNLYPSKTGEGHGWVG
jgi:hypothetical protein